MARTARTATRISSVRETDSASSNTIVSAAAAASTRSMKLHAEAGMDHNAHCRTASQCGCVWPAVRCRTVTGVPLRSPPLGPVGATRAGRRAEPARLVGVPMIGFNLPQIDRLYVNDPRCGALGGASGLGSQKGGERCDEELGIWLNPRRAVI